MAKMVLKTKETTALSGPVLTAVSDLGKFKEGDKLTTDKVQVEYGTLFANDKSDGDTIDLPTEDVLTVIRSVEGDNASAWDMRSDKLWDAHNKAHPTPDISVSIPSDVKELAAQIDEEFADTFGEFIEAKKKTKYGALLVMHALEQVYEDTIDMWPMPDNDKDEVPEGYKTNGIPAFDKGYRPKPKSEKGIPSWYADLFDAMPDVGSHRFGQTIATELAHLAKIEGKMDKAQHASAKKDLSEERTAGIGLLKRAMKLRFKLQAIGPVVLKSITQGTTTYPVSVKETGLKNVGYSIRVDNKTKKILRTSYPIAVLEVGTAAPQITHLSVGKVLALKPEELPDDCTWQQLVDSSGEGTQDDASEDEGPTKYSKVEEIDTAVAILATTFTDQHMWTTLGRALRMQNKKTKEYLNLPLVESLQCILDNLESIKPTLDAIQSEENKRKEAMKEKQARLAKEKAAKNQAA